MYESGRYLRCWRWSTVTEVEAQSVKRRRLLLQSKIRASDASLPPRLPQVLSRGPKPQGGLHPCLSHFWDTAYKHLHTVLSAYITLGTLLAASLRL